VLDFGLSLLALHRHFAGLLDDLLDQHALGLLELVAIDHLVRSVSHRTLLQMRVRVLIFHNNKHYK
jgi:hypothetical protein